MDQTINYMFVVIIMAVETWPNNHYFGSFSKKKKLMECSQNEQNAWKAHIKPN